jgi:hypothetical protein
MVAANTKFVLDYPQTTQLNDGHYATNKIVEVGFSHYYKQSGYWSAELPNGAKGPPRTKVLAASGFELPFARPEQSQLAAVEVAENLPTLPLH